MKVGVLYGEKTRKQFYLNLTVVRKFNLVNNSVFRERGTNNKSSIIFFLQIENK